MSIKQGVKYDHPASARDIPAFIAFHNLKVDEILEPLDSFSKQFIMSISSKLGSSNNCFSALLGTFNEFFYRLVIALWGIQSINQPNLTLIATQETQAYGSTCRMPR